MSIYESQNGFTLFVPINKALESYDANDYQKLQSDFDSLIFSDFLPISAYKLKKKSKSPTPI